MNSSKYTKNIQKYDEILDHEKNHRKNVAFFSQLQKLSWGINLAIIKGQNALF